MDPVPVELQLILKPNAPKKRGIVSIEDGCLDFASDLDGSILTWPLEAIIRNRRNPKLPLLHIHFDSSVTLFPRDQTLPGQFPADAVFTFQVATERDTFLNAIVTAKNEWLAQKKQKAESSLVAAEQQQQLPDNKFLYECFKEQLSQKLLTESANRKESQKAQTITSRSYALQMDRGLNFLYENLVILNQSLTEEEFWERHTQALAGSLSIPSPEESFFFPNSQTPKQILFQESDFVKTRHQELVGTSQLTETEFWNRLFNSRYYAKLSGKLTIPQPDPYFDQETNDDDVQTLNTTIVSDLLPNTIMLGTLDFIEKPGFGIKPATDSVASNSLSGLTLLERFNRHANRSLMARENSTALFSGSQPEDLLASTPSPQSLSLMANLVTLESLLYIENDQSSLSKQIYKYKADQSTKQVVINDLIDFPETQKSTHNHRARRVVLSLKNTPTNPPVNLAAEIHDFQEDLNVRPSPKNQIFQPASNELVATCCFVKFTSSVKASHKAEQERQLREAMESEHLLGLFNSMADLQAKVQEILYHVYKSPFDTHSRSWRHALESIKLELENVRRLEIDTAGNRSLTAIINTRTLCQPILNAIECALLKLSSE